MSALKEMQAFAALLFVFNVLDVLTTSYALHHRLGREANGIVDWVMRKVGCTWMGLLLVKAPLLATCLAAMFPVTAARLGAPAWYMVNVAGISTWTWAALVAFYAVVVVNNLRIVWDHALTRLEEAEWSKW